MLFTTLRILRTAHHLSYQDLADILNVSTITYCFYETGRRCPPISCMYTLANYYQVSLDYLYGRSDVPARPGDHYKRSRTPLSDYSNVSTTLGNRLRYLRCRNNLRQNDLASYLGISRPAYSYYESGKRQPSPENLVKLADYYRVSIDWLCGRKF